jgi:hypothetical protein
MKDKTELSDIYTTHILLNEADEPIPSAMQPAEDSDQIAGQASGMVKDVNASDAEVSPVDDPDFEDMEDLEDLADAGGGINAIEQFRDTDITTYTYKTLVLYMHWAYEAQVETGQGGLLIYGDPGLGKSAIVEQFAQELANSSNRTYHYINWHDAPDDQKQEIMSDPSMYFILLDLRVAQMEPTDIQGIPDPFSDKEYLQTKPPDWGYLFTRPDAAGILFLDEINQGDEQTLKALFEVIHDHKIAGRRMSGKVAVFGAGNLGSEFGNDPIPQALASRFEQGGLVADPEGWLEYAEKHNVNARIIAFVKSNPSENFYAKPVNPDDPYPTPRQFVKLSTAMGLIQRRYSVMKKSGQKPPIPLYRALADKSAAYCGVTWARKFLVFLEHMRMFDMKQLLADPESFIKDRAPDELYALTAFISGKLKTAMRRIKRSGQAEPDQDMMEIIEGVAKITLNVKEEFRAILWNMIASEIPDKKQKEFILNLVVHGDYDPATKAAVQGVLSKVRDFMKG